MNSKSLATLTTVVLGMIAIAATPVNAQSCTSLKVVGATGTEVTKRVTPPSTILTNNNWNTDFAVPSGMGFNRYVATITSQNDASYGIKLFLKYSDNTTDKFYDSSGVQLKVGKPFKVTGTARPRTDPYQINVFVGGIDATGNTYTISVAGCY